MPKWCKTIIAILLLPVCFGAVKTLWQVLRATGGDPASLWIGILSGAACWVVVYLMLPRPMLMYVWGHELTHVLWTWLFGGKVKKFKATAKGGHVVVTKNNFLISLAPYFFPLYAVLVVFGFIIGHLIWNWHPYLFWFHLLLGAAYAFHVTLTCHILKTEQSDITQHGYLFSAVIVFLGNIAVLLLGFPLLSSRLGLLEVLRWWMNYTGDELHRLGSLF